MNLPTHRPTTQPKRKKKNTLSKKERYYRAQQGGKWRWFVENADGSTMPCQDPEWKQ